MISAAVFRNQNSTPGEASVEATRSPEETSAPRSGIDDRPDAMRMENRRYFNQEGKEAKNFYHLSDDGGEEKTYFRKPPVNLRPRSIQSASQCKSAAKSGAPRVRSASTGRDKKSELQARYWAFLFGNLQRSVNEIYQTVECYENLPSCQEAILVLENYIRDFRALAEWFKVSWDYEATPLPQRPQSLAWEVRKSNPAPRVRKPISSPGISGKSSPSFSGKNSPCHALDGKFGHQEGGWGRMIQCQQQPQQQVVECGSLENYVLKLDQYTQTNLDDENLTLAEYLEKYCKKEEEVKVESAVVEVVDEVKVVEDLEDKKVVEEKVEVKKVAAPVTKYAAVVTSAVTKPAIRTSLQSKTVPPARSIPPKTVKTTVPAAPAAPSNVRKSATLSSLSQTVTKTVSLPAKSATTMIEINNRRTDGLKQPAPPPTTSKLSFSRKTSRDDIDSSSSTLKASTDRLGSRSSINEGSTKGGRVQNVTSRRSEPKSMPSDANGNDGWYTVKTKRRSSLHWATRFNQPSGYASLPTLSLLDENGNAEEADKQESSENVGKPKPAKSTPAPAPQVPAKPTPALNGPTRQKSDLTGLKLKTLHREFLRNEKLKLKPVGDGATAPEPLQQEKIEPVVVVQEDVAAAAAIAQLNKVDMNIQTNLVSSTIQNLVELQLSSCDELEEREDMESDEDQRKLLEEQESLEAQIRELENTEIDIDTETDETDCEAIIDLEDNESCVENLETVHVNGDAGGDEEMTLEMRYESVLAEMTWVERAQTLATLQALVARHPGRAQQLHAKLSSPSRRRSLHETLKKYQAKQTRATEKRLALQREKATKIQQLLTRVEDVKTAKQQLIEKKRMRMEERLQRAAENRTQYLKDKIKKAHDEEEKLKEIAFIKNLEAQNKRLDFIESCKEQEGRLQDLETERQKKAEEKAAKEAAVERRRLEIEQERQKKLQIMSEFRREREKRVGKMQEQKEKQRKALAQEKARDREERLLALQAQQQATTEELQRKIIQKQQESARRHEENIEHIRQRAVELTIPTRNADELNCNSKPDQENEDNLSVSDKGKENSNAKANKKRLRKLRLRMVQEADEYIAELQPLTPQIRKQSQVPKLLNSIVKGGGPVGVERPLGQLLRLMAKAEVVDFQSMWLLDGLKTIADVIEQGMEPNSEISKRAVVISVQLYRNACSLCPQISRHAILGNSVTVLLDALQISLK
ncbi:hypothetical protein pipiens_012365, partial [Culex pipiens pipiens]